MKSAVFMPMKEAWKMERLAKAYIKHVVRLHGVPKVIILDRIPGFFRDKCGDDFGTILNRRITFHSALDGQTRRTIQTLKIC